MEKKIIEVNGVKAAVIHSGEIIIRDAQSALDLIAEFMWQDGCDRIALPASAFAPEFFDLTSGLAGEVLQKFVNYRKKLAIIGDFSAYEGRALGDFIRESNKGGAIFFAPGEDKALELLARAR